MGMGGLSRSFFDSVKVGGSKELTNRLIHTPTTYTG